MDAHTPQRAGVRVAAPAAPRRRAGGDYVGRAHNLLPRSLWPDLNLMAANDEDDYDMMDVEQDEDEYTKGRRELKRAREHWVRIK